ncbi:MAG TPA: SIMPL domain-containing protein [Thermoanaerobaculia bacterium]|nr:SIMPL domain-containing protein [Thermoanaerobaculia bacterium]
MRKRLTVAAVLALLALPLTAQPPRPPAAGGGPMDAVSILTVSGSGQARVAPDLATVRLGVVAQAPTARAAQDQVSRTAGAVLDAIRKVGIAAEDLQTSGLSLSPLYSQSNRPGGESQAPRITGYQANNTVTVRVTDLAKAGPVIDAGLGAGANTLDGVDFGLRNDEAARAQALADAARAARAKAETLAKALGVRLGEILEVTEGGVSVSPPPYPRFGAVRAMAESAMAPTPVSAGQVGVEASVTIRYRISQ